MIAPLGVAVNLVENGLGALPIECADAAFELFVSAVVFGAKSVDVEAVFNAATDITLGDLVYCHCASSSIKR